MSKHIDGTLCPLGTHPVKKVHDDDPCNGCKLKGTIYCVLPLCLSRWRPDQCVVTFAEGAKPRLVLLRKIEGGYADIGSPGWAKSVRAYYGKNSTSGWKDIHIMRKTVKWAIGICAYEFSSKSVEELENEAL